MVELFLVNLSALPVSKRMGWSVGCQGDFGEGRDEACYTGPWGAWFFFTALALEVLLMLDSSKTRLSLAFGNCDSCSVLFSTESDTVQIRRQYGNILKVLRAKYQPLGSIPRKKKIFQKHSNPNKYDTRPAFGCPPFPSTFLYSWLFFSVEDLIREPAVGGYVSLISYNLK